MNGRSDYGAESRGLDVGGLNACLSTTIWKFRMDECHRLIFISKPTFRAFGPT